MTPAQTKTVKSLRLDGFTLVLEASEIVRMTKGADRRVIFRDGSQKRGHHTEERGKK